MSSPPAADGAAARGTAALRLELAVRVGAHAAEIPLDAGHCERLFRTATYVALRDAALGPDETVEAMLVAGRVRERHGDVACLDSCAVALTDARRRVVTRVEFPRAAFAAFAAARALHLIATAGGGGGRGDVASGAVARDADTTPGFTYSLHGHPKDEAPAVISLPEFSAVSLRALTDGAEVHGEPDDRWIATIVTTAALAGFAALERRSRASGVEGAARVRARIGFDPSRRCFVRVLEEVVIDERAAATATSVVSSAASWAPFLEAGVAATRAPSIAHTHLHLSGREGGHAARGDDLLASGARVDSQPATLDREGLPVISLEDVVSMYLAFPEPLSASAIVSLFPERSVLKIYGYTPGALLREEPGYWVIPGTRRKVTNVAGTAKTSRRAPQHEASPDPERKTSDARTPR